MDKANALKADAADLDEAQTSCAEKRDIVESVIETLLSDYS